jgi:hypothetical protein
MALFRLQSNYLTPLLQSNHLVYAHSHPKNAMPPPPDNLIQVDTLDRYLFSKPSVRPLSPGPGSMLPCARLR